MDVVKPIRDLWEGEYPPGTLGYERERLLRKVSELPWWLWPLKRHLRGSLKRSRQRMHEAQGRFFGLK